jgi:hypothetical protein
MIYQYLIKNLVVLLHSDLKNLKNYLKSLVKMENILLKNIFLMNIFTLQ